MQEELEKNISKSSISDNFVSNKKIMPTHDLYGVSPSIFKDMSYVDVLQLKIEAARKVVKKELEVHYMKRDSIKISKALDAEKFNYQLLKEMGL